MRNRFLATLGFVLTLAVGVSWSDEPANVEGNWSFSASVANRNVEQIFVIKQEGNKISGTFAPKGNFVGAGPLQGTVEAKTISFQVATSHGSDSYKGTVEGDTMKGTVTIGTNTNPVTWIAKRTLATATAVITADDPFTGTWREKIEMTISPYGDGFSIQAPDGTQQNIGKFGQNVLWADGSTVNIVRVDGHNLISTVLNDDGGVIVNETASVSPDGNKYTRVRKYTTFPREEILEFERVGKTPEGDAFFGTWRRTSPLNIYTIKIDGDAYDIALDNSSRLGMVTANPSFLGMAMRGWNGKLDGKEYKGPTDDVTTQARRIDAQTIEIKQTFTPPPQIVLLQNGTFQCSGFGCTPEIKIKADGTDRPAQGSETYDTEAVKVVDDRTIEFTDKKDGKIVSSERDTVTADGETTIAEITFYPKNGKQSVTSKTIWSRMASGPSGSHAVSGTWTLPGSGSITQWQVKGDTLTRTTRRQRNQGGQNQPLSSVQKFERIK